jgi:hypothetical protein
VKKYTNPYMARYGNSKNVIQGNCGLGVENWTLDKTGYYMKRVYIAYAKMDTTCINNICTTTIERGCEWVDKCNGTSNC